LDKEQKPDIIVLLEWRDNRVGNDIRGRLKEFRLSTAVAVNGLARSNGVLIAAKTSFDDLRITPKASDKGELLLATFPAGLRLLAAYFPQKTAKSPFFQICVDEALKNDQTPFLLVGDLNTGRNDLDRQATGSRFHCAKMFEALVDQAKLVDLWRDEARTKLQKWTWESRKRNEFRVDHAFGNKPFLERYPRINCVYDHSPRIIKITDHSATEHLDDLVNLSATRVADHMLKAKSAHVVERFTRVRANIDPFLANSRRFICERAR
jgi:exonuclease III